MPLVDSHSRTINYLRLSVTDRCNLRCSYCMPAEGVEKCGHDDVLRYEELYLLAETAVSLGIEKIRVTGGEPLVRRGIVSFLDRLRQFPGLQELVLTTNGILLPQMAADLKAAGVTRLNISLDSLRSDVFRQITRCGDLQQVLDGISAAEQLGIPVKLNMVVMAGINDQEIEEFAALSLQRPLAIRFIEYMPAVTDDNWKDRVVSGREILRRLAQRYSFDPVGRQARSGPSRDFRIHGAAGTIGVITPVFEHFCQECNRIRISSTGQVRSCLFSTKALDLRPYLQAGDKMALQRILQDLVACKPLTHDGLPAADGKTSLGMSAIGG